VVRVLGQHHHRKARRCRSARHDSHDRDERKRRYKLLTRSGVVVQHEDGSPEAVKPKAARKHLSEMSPERRAMHEKR